MKRYLQRFMVLVSTLLLLTACFAPETPQEVTEAFWKGVIENDTDAVVEYSTLSDSNAYDAFSKSWEGYQPTWGRVVIEDDKANIDGEFIKAGSIDSSRRFVTYLVRQGDQWKVDYKRTARGVDGGVLGQLLGTLTDLGNDLSEQFSSSANEFNDEMARMSKEFEELSESLSEQAADSIHLYGEELRKNIEDLEESVTRLLEEQGDNLSESDRRKLNNVASDLGEDSDNLSDPTLDSIAEGSKNVGKAQQLLNEIDSELIDDYKKQWKAWRENVEDDMAKMLEELSASEE